jgi:hypothetical protein
MAERQPTPSDSLSTPEAPRSPHAAPAPGPASTPAGAAVESGVGPAPDRRAVYGRERAEYGGIKFGVAFFGWLSATGLTVILSAIAAGIIAAIGIDSEAASISSGAALGSAIVLLAILFVSYTAGGYVAGRMARFAGVKQGLAVWIWGVLVTIVLIVVAAVAGPDFEVFTRAGLVPDIDFSTGEAVGTGLVLAGIVVVTLVGAIVGGIAGMRFHRRVDRAGWAE